MMTADPQTILDQRLRDAMRTALADQLPDNADPLLAPSRNPDFGDFQANAAMGLAKHLGMKPRELAESIVKALRIDDLAETPDIAGPGFINIRLKPDALARALDALDTPTLAIDPPPKDQSETVVVDLCGVNLAKQMHVGHLRATVIGDAIARLFSRLGHTVKRQNHFGDWGLPIAMVTESVKRLSEQNRIQLDKLTLEDLEALYRKAQIAAAPDRRGLDAVNRFDLGPKAQAELEEQVSGAIEALERSKQALVALQSGDPHYRAVWQRISEITLQACFDNCQRLHTLVTNEHTAGESTYAADLRDVVADLENRSIAEHSEGALVVRLDEFGIKEPVLIRKSDGGFLYATTDLAAIRRRVQQLHADRVVYAVDARQSLHFRQVFAAARKAGYTRKPGPEPHPHGPEALLLHAAFGTVLGNDGRPFKTRAGDNVKLSDLLDEAVARADRAVAEKNPDLSTTERADIARAVAITAIKYADLSSDRIKDYVFDFDRMLAFEGNTGPYLQYALVRVRSIFRKAAERFDFDEALFDSPSRPPLLINAPEEKTLALAILRYPTAVRAAAESCEPHRLCTYLFDLATAFSAFFTACPVLQAEDESTRLSRLRLTRLTGRVLRDGLESLGLIPLERM